jgi:hypothetical protein
VVPKLPQLTYAVPGAISERQVRERQSALLVVVVEPLRIEFLRVGVVLRVSVHAKNRDVNLSPFLGHHISSSESVVFGAAAS